MLDYQFCLVSSLEKVFPDSEPNKLKEGSELSGLIGETISFQLAYRVDYTTNTVDPPFHLKINSAIKDRIHVRSVKLVPSEFPAYGRYDENYITTKPGLFPDLLVPVRDDELKLYPCQWRAIWFDIELAKELANHTEPVIIRIDREEETIWEQTVPVRILQAALPPQQLIHTEWFHADCLANYYKVPVFSEEHWRIIENFIGTAVKNGINMILTPIFTPPLDTREGGERTTVQLIQIIKEGGRYRFQFSLFRRWLAICKRKGVSYIEICHLFTQWGAKHAPKIMSEENGVLKRIFGWETDADSREYKEFLDQLLPELKKVLREEDFLQNTYFHISDEPGEEHKVSYAAAKKLVSRHLADCKVIDASSSYKLYQEGIVEHPVVCNDEIQNFIDAKVPDLWTYYCCGQCTQVSNRFFAMPSARNRILGVQLYLYDIKGFLHWGYNFYNSMYSISPIDPFRVTDADGGFPSGDPFLVYPAEDGTAYESIRLMVLSEALYDLRALRFLEALTDRPFVEQIILEGLDRVITFTQYPHEASYLINLRERVNSVIMKYSKIDRQRNDANEVELRLQEAESE